MKILLTIVNFLFLTTLPAQTKTVINIKHSSGDSSFWYKYQLIVSNSLSLVKLDTSSSPFYFRVWTTNQVIDICRNKDESYSGILTTWVTEQTPHNEKSTGRISIDKKTLPLDTVLLILQLIESSRILNLPADDSIKGWKQGFDGITYITEYSNKTDYSFKTYWTPKAQDTTLTEAKIVQSFVDSIFAVCNSKTVWENFQKTIPYECYNLGDLISCRIMTKKERRKLFKERKNYRQNSVAKIGAAR